MAIYYLDSSALVKRYVTEKGSDWIQTLLHPTQDHMCFTTRITQVEFSSAIARQVRDGRLPSTVQNSLLDLFNYHQLMQYHLVELDAEVCKKAISLNSSHPLRAYDSVQLASALRLAETLLAASVTGLTFLASDIRLLKVAEMEGLQVDDPENH